MPTCKRCGESFGNGEGEEKHAGECKGVPKKPRIKNTVMKNGKRYVCKIWDNGGLTIDRYTVVFRAYRDHDRGEWSVPALAASSRPFSTFGQHIELRKKDVGPHLGKRVAFEDVSEELQRFILQNLVV